MLDPPAERWSTLPADRADRADVRIVQIVQIVQVVRIVRIARGSVGHLEELLGLGHIPQNDGCRATRQCARPGERRYGNGHQRLPDPRRVGEIDPGR